MPDASIFIGYRSQDAPWARALSEQLSDAGVATFLDTPSLRAGQRWSRELERALATAEVFVALLADEPDTSPEGNDGHYFDHEVQTAIERYRRFRRPVIVPIYVRMERPPLDLPYGLRPFQGLFLRGEHWADVVEPLISLVGGTPGARQETLDAELRRLRLRLAHAHASKEDVAHLEAELRALEPAPSEVETIRRGRLIDDRYQLLEETARDSLCSTWRALDTYLAEFVSLRVYDAERLEDPRAGSWSRMSAERWARLRHPGIARLRDRLRVEPLTGLGYLSIESGDSTLRLAIDGGRVTGAELIDVLRPLAEALDQTSSGAAGHLRVNPQTIMVTADGQAKLTGFSPLTAKRSEVMQHLAADELRYMAPEVVWMADDALGPHVDQYSLAMVAVTILHGGRLDVRVVRDTAGFVRRLPGCGPQATACLLRALDTDPAQRFADCTTFVDALEQARVIDDFDDIGGLLVSDQAYARLIHRDLRRLRCAGLPIELVASIPDDPRPNASLEVEISHLRSIVDPTDADTTSAYHPQRSRAFSQWVRNVRLMLSMSSPLTRKLDSALLVLDHHRPALPLCRQLDARFGQLLDLLLTHEPQKTLAALRGVLGEHRHLLATYDNPRLDVISDLLTLAAAAETEEGSAVLGRWLDPLVRRVPSMAHWVDDTRAALVDAEPRERQGAADHASPGSRDARAWVPGVVRAVLALGSYGDARASLLDGLPIGLTARLPLMRSAWDQVNSDVRALEQTPGGLPVWLGNALRIAEIMGPLGTSHRVLSRALSSIHDTDDGRLPGAPAEPSISARDFAARTRSDPGWALGGQQWFWVVVEALSSLFAHDYVERRKLVLHGISPWAVGWLPEAQSTFEQIYLDGVTLLRLGSGRGGYMAYWLSNLRVLQHPGTDTSGESAIVRVAHAQLDSLASSWEWSAAERPPETAQIEQPLRGAGLADVFEHATARGLFGQLDRVQLLLDIPRRIHAELPLMQRPLEQMRSDLLGLASQVTTDSPYPLVAWLTRAERLARERGDYSTVYAEARGRLLRRG